MSFRLPSARRPFPSGSRRLAGVAVVIGLLLAGCGGGSSGSSAAGAPGSSSAPAASAPSSSPVVTAGGTGSVAPAPVESSVPGDIPDNVAYVPYVNPAGHYAFSHPEGWVQSGSGSTVTFTDKLNGITAAANASSAVPTVQSARSTDIPTLQHSQPAFELRSVRPLTLPAGTGVLIVYRRNSAPDPVTGKVFRDEVNRYEVVGHGHRVDLELYGAVGSDNVDPYTKISQSLRLS